MNWRKGISWHMWGICPSIVSLSYYLLTRGPSTEPQILVNHRHLLNVHGLPVSHSLIASKVAYYVTLHTSEIILRNIHINQSFQDNQAYFRKLMKGIKEVNMVCFHLDRCLYSTCNTWHEQVPGEDHNCVALWDAWLDTVNTETDSPVPGWENSFMLMGNKAHTGSKMVLWGRG